MQRGFLLAGTRQVAMQSGFLLAGIRQVAMQSGFLFAGIRQVAMQSGSLFAGTRQVAMQRGFLLAGTRQVTILSGSLLPEPGKLYRARYGFVHDRFCGVRFPPRLKRPKRLKGFDLFPEGTKPCRAKNTIRNRFPKKYIKIKQ
jgi:vacuolar-type H+-ATPase subunit F/Vma7